MFYVGLDVSVARTAVCIMDAAGEVVREQSMASTPGRSRRRSGHSGGRSSGLALRLASTPPGSRGGGVVAWVGEMDALTPAPIGVQAVRTEFGRSNSSMRLRT